MNWTAILAKAGIPDVPGRAEVLEVMRRRRGDKEAAAWKALHEKIEKHQQQLAAQGDTRKAIRSKVRVGAR